MICVVSPHLPPVEEVLRNQARPGSAGMAPLLHSIFIATPRNTAPSYQTTLGMVLSPLQHHQHQFIQFCAARSIKKLSIF